MSLGTRLIGLTLGAFVAAAAGRTVLHAQAPDAPIDPSLRRVVATTATDLRSWDVQVTRLAQTGELLARRTDDDPLLPGRQHERFAQFYKGVPVYGGDIVRQIDGGLTVSIFGTLYESVDLDVTPRLTQAEATDVIAQASGVTLGPAKPPTLVVYPHDGTFTLAYRARVFREGGATELFIDANSGSVLRRLNAARRQSAVGVGTGVLGDTKKMSVIAQAGGFRSADALRPPDLLTFDMHGSLAHTLDFLNGVVALGQGDIASDSDNTWQDQAVVDAHAYSGYVYDFYFKRFGRRGLDNNNFRILNIVHPVSRADALTASPDEIGTFYLNAFYAGDGIMIYGEGLPFPAFGFQWNYFAGALDIVGHELTHGVTDFTSQLLYENESGALNESFSDMMGTAVEAYFQAPGTKLGQSDYAIGEDVVVPGGARSMDNPGLFGDPDHYSRRVIEPNDEDHDNGGVHTNSGIGNQAYYLAIEGGVNRTSGLSVQGVGHANREQIEKVMYRAFTLLMPANATYSVARAATIQAARDLYGAGSPAERAVTQAWAAVGVN